MSTTTTTAQEPVAPPSSGYWDGHTLTLNIQPQYLDLQWVCPHTGETFTDTDTAPLCRTFDDDNGTENISPQCVPGEHFGELGAEAFTAIQHAPFDFAVRVLPIHVEWWFETPEELYVLPYQPDPATGFAGRPGDSDE